MKKLKFSLIILCIAGIFGTCKKDKTTAVPVAETPIALTLMGIEGIYKGSYTDNADPAKTFPIWFLIKPDKKFDLLNTDSPYDVVVSGVNNNTFKSDSPNGQFQVKIPYAGTNKDKTFYFVGEFDKTGKINGTWLNINDDSYKGIWSAQKL